MRIRLFICTVFLFFGFCMADVFACSDALRIVMPGDIFILRKGEAVQISQAGPEIKIDWFYNSPCPTDVQCIWSGVGIVFEWTYKNEIRKGVNLTQAFGYRVEILETDYESYAKLVFEKKNPGSAVK